MWDFEGLQNESTSCHRRPPFKWAVISHLHVKGLQAEERMMLANNTKAMTNVLFVMNVVMTVTHLADMKKWYESNQSDYVQIQSKATVHAWADAISCLQTGTAPKEQVITHPASGTKGPIQYPKGMALLRAAMSGRVVVCTLKGSTWKRLVPWPAAPTDQLNFFNFV